MTIRHCENPGCGRLARWERTATGNGALPRLLCRDHWQTLRMDAPLDALGYRPVMFGSFNGFEGEVHAAESKRVAQDSRASGFEG